MKWPRFICFIGIDGSGKTTLAKALIKFSNKNGNYYHYVWAHNQPIFVAPFRKAWQLIFLRNKNMFTNYDDYNETKKRVARKSIILNAFYLFIHSVDYILWIVLRVQLPLLFGRRIVCDRYVYDVAVNLSLLLDYQFQETVKFINIYFKYIPKPDLVFLIDVPEEVAFKRKNDIPSLSYLRDRRIIYSELARLYSICKLDGTTGIDRLYQLIQENIKHRFPKCANS